MIGNRLKEYRKTKGCKSKEIANKIGISQGSFSDLERGKTDPSAETILKIIRNTDINIYWLLTGEGNKIWEGKREGNLEFRESQEKYIPGELPGWFKKVKKILESDSDYSRALDANINAFHRAIASEEDLRAMKERVDYLEARVATLEGLIKNQNQTPSAPILKYEGRKL